MFKKNKSCYKIHFLKARKNFLLRYKNKSCSMNKILVARIKLLLQEKYYWPYLKFYYSWINNVFLWVSLWGFWAILLGGEGRDSRPMNLRISVFLIASLSASRQCQRGGQGQLGNALKSKSPVLPARGAPLLGHFPGVAQRGATDGDGPLKSTHYHSELWGIVSKAKHLWVCLDDALLCARVAKRCRAGGRAINSRNNIVVIGEKKWNVM